VLADAIVDVTGVPDRYTEVALNDGSTQKTEAYAAGTRALQLHDAAIKSRFLDTFGRNPRDITCECERSSQPSLVQVLNLSNGTTLNDEPVRETRLKRGDKIQVGQTVLLFVDDLAIRAQGVTLEQVRIVPPDTGEDKSAIVQALPVMADMSQLFAGNAPPFWLQERLASLDVIYKASREINLITDPNELLPRILELVFDAIGADRTVA